MLQSSAVDEAVMNGLDNLPRPAGWQSWLHRDVVGYFILGMLVPLPQMTIMSAARLMFPGITGIFGVVLAVPAAVASYALPFFAHFIPYPVIVIINVVVAILSIVTCTLGTSLVGPVSGTVLAGIGAALGQYLYLAIAAFYDQKTVVTFSIGTRVIFVIRAAMYMGFMVAFHDDWRLSVRIITPLPLVHGLVYWFLLSPQGRLLAEQTRHQTSQRITDRASGSANEDTAQTTGSGETSNSFPRLHSPQHSVFSSTESFQHSSHSFSLLPIIDLSNQAAFHGVLEQFGCSSNDQKEERDQIVHVVPSIGSIRRPLSSLSLVSHHVSTCSIPRRSKSPAPTLEGDDLSQRSKRAPGFSQGRSKVHVLWFTVIPYYVVPLMISVAGSMIAMTGLAPTYIFLNSFRTAPQGDLNYQLNTFSSGLAAVLFASISLYRSLPCLWIWALCQFIIIILGVLNLFHPFFSFFAVWLIFAFFTGGIEGAAVTNTNFKIAADFAKKGESDEVRSFAMSFGALGNFAGDVLGGSVAIAIQVLGEKYLPVRH